MRIMFEKLDESENNVLDGKNSKMITDENKLPIENSNNFAPRSDVADEYKR